MTFTDLGMASDKSWVGDFENREHVLPGGAQLAAAGSWSGLTNSIVPHGTIVGRTTAEREAGADFGPAGDADDEVFLVLDDTDVSATSDRGTNLYRHNSLVKFDRLPSWEGASAAVKDKLRAAYTLIQSAQ
jgi:hypothetical protein